MPDDVTAERVRIVAAAARVPLDAASTARVAGAVTPAVQRFAAAQLDYPFETEPASYVVVARADAAK
jgi:hypothetical protein